MKQMNQENINTAEHYDELYAIDSNRRHELRAYPQIVDFLRMIRPSTGMVLDIGCGVGEYFNSFPGCRVFGTELSMDAAREARSMYDYEQIAQWAVGQPDPFPTRLFDLIWCGEVIEHVEHPYRLMEFIISKLAPGGMLVLSTPFEDSIQCPEHLWGFDSKDLRALVSPLKLRCMFRFCNEPVERWEHFLVVATK